MLKVLEYHPRSDNTGRMFKFKSIGESSCRVIILSLLLPTGTIVAGANFDRDEIFSLPQTSCPVGHVFVNNTRSCWPISNSSDDSCNYDAQCYRGSWGIHSRCSPEHMKCECIDMRGRAQGTVMINGVCQIQKTIFDSCSHHDECRRSIQGAVDCVPGKAVVDDLGTWVNKFEGRICRCRLGAWEATACLHELTDVNDKCKNTAQCTSILGNYSRCSFRTARCECKEDFLQNSGVYHNTIKTCFPKKMFNDTCSGDDECRASLGPRVKCGTNEEHPDNMVCHYDDNFDRVPTTSRIADFNECIHGYAYVNETESCWRIASTPYHPCNFDAQCPAEIWGLQSTCSKVKGVCQCHSGSGAQETVFIDGLCRIIKTIGDPCLTDEECTVTMKEDVFCKADNPPTNKTTEGLLTPNKTCQCKDTHLWYPPIRQCLIKSTGINGNCTVSEQCREASLGKFSRCNSETKLCECHGGGSDKDIVYHYLLKKCFPRRMFNEMCENDEECRASLDPKVKCGTNDEHPDKMVCHYDYRDIGGPFQTYHGNNDDVENPGVIIGAGIFGIATVVICLVNILLGCRRLCIYAKSKIKQQNTETELERISGENRIPACSSLETTCSQLSVRIYSAAEITSMSLVGEGCFGQVFKGTLNGASIAVKKIKGEGFEDIMREVETMANFSHPNILSLLGVAQNSDVESPWLLFEFMEHGDLIGVLRDDKFKPRSSMPNYDNVEVESDESQLDLQLQLTNETLLHMASQIAEGMNFLSSHRFIHRDLAARNCLVGATGTIKISDFGLSRDVYSNDYYRGSGNKLLPIRWMAPESIGYGCFTVESDIWAYGVVLWEMFSFGKQPYFGLAGEEVMNRITDGVLLNPPDDCPTVIKELMLACWKRDPKSRPTFKQICERFTVFPQEENEGRESNIAGIEVQISGNLPEYFHVVEKL